MALSDDTISWGKHEIKGPVHTYREKLMLRIVQRYAQGDKVLDAGCGTGSLAVKLSRGGFRVTGIDSSEDCVRWLGLKSIRENLCSRIDVSRADVEVIPFLSNSFDVVTCGEVLEHLEDDALAVGEFHRVLRAGGICVVTVPSDPELWSVCDVRAGHLRRYTRVALGDLFLENGFEILYMGNWGFPLIRLYQRFLFRPYMARPKNGLKSSSSTNRPGGWAFEVISFLLSRLFLFDNLFLSGTWGVGEILVACKETS